MTRARLVVAAGLLGLLALLGTGCRKKPVPFAQHLWFSGSAGCVETKPTAAVPPLACWGTNDVGQLGDGTMEPRAAATAATFPVAGKLTDLALGARHACAVFDHRVLACWGDGGQGQLGVATPGTLVPAVVPEPSEGDLAVRVGGAHTCVRAGLRDRLRCFGANDEGQLGWRADGREDPAAWTPEGTRREIRAFSLGAAHTCVAYGAPEQVRCRGRAPAAPREALLGGIAVTALAAGDDHTCALLPDRTVRCWGRNDAGQLGDGTTNDALAPVTVAGLAEVDGIAAGARHTCARLLNGTVACWGANDRHQLANGTSEPGLRPGVVVGVLGVQELAAGGDATCARLGDGYVRCWGRNDRGQLGDVSTVEHSVPMPIRYR